MSKLWPEPYLLPACASSGGSDETIENSYDMIVLGSNRNTLSIFLIGCNASIITILIWILQSELLSNFRIAHILTHLRRIEFRFLLFGAVHFRFNDCWVVHMYFPFLFKFRQSYIL